MVPRLRGFLTSAIGAISVPTVSMVTGWDVMGVGGSSCWGSVEMGEVVVVVVDDDGC